MRPVVVLIFHAAAGSGPITAGSGPLAAAPGSLSAPRPLTAALAGARLALAGHHQRGFRAAGAEDVRIIADADDRPFGARLRDEAATLPAGAGLVVLGSGAIPLADARDRRRFLAAAAGSGSGAAESGGRVAGSGGRAAGGGGRAALANNLYSGDVVAIPDARRILAGLPDLAGDNALPRWLAEQARIPVADLRGHRALQADLDGVADLALLVRSPRCPAVVRAAAARLGPELADVRGRIGAVEAVAADRRAEIVVAGRVSAAGLRHLEAATACRVRALVEERGLRAADARAQAEDAAPAPAVPHAPAPAAAPTAEAVGGGTHAAPVPTPAPVGARRPPASALGMLLDHGGPSALGPLLARLGDAAIVDTRVLLAHRLGPDERAWPSLEDRLASDLGMADAVRDPWLRSLTESAATATIPVLLGAHSLVGPGLDLLFRRASRRPRADRAGGLV